MVGNVEAGGRSDMLRDGGDSNGGGGGNGGGDGSSSDARCACM